MVKISSADGCISLGPWGATGGEPWAYKSNGLITQIIVRSGGAVDSISFQSKSSDGIKLESSDKIGGRGGNRTEKVFIDSPLEHFTTLDMTLGDFEGQSVIKSLSFHTNLTKYGPFGSKSGTSVSIPMEGGVIVGFHSRAGKYLTAIGIYVAPNVSSFWQLASQESCQTHVETPISKNLFVPRDPGPWGAQRGMQWDDGVFLAVKQVILRTGQTETPGGTVIQGVQFVYVQRDGKFFISPHHGCFSDTNVQKIELESPGEIIVGMDGFYGPVDGTNGLDIITSITIHTNKRIFGPFGENQMGTYFSSTHSGGKAVGFFGRKGNYLNAIGVHMEYS